MRAHPAGLLVLGLLTACASDLPRTASEKNSFPVDGPANSGGAPAGRHSASRFDTNAEGLKIIKDAEGLRLKAYELGDNVFIGYGHLVLDGEPEVITEAQAENYLKRDLGYCEQSLERYITVPVTANEFSALTGLCYNIGVGAIKNSSVIRELNAGNREEAAEAFLMWNKMGDDVSSHLSDRRRKERALFLKQ